MYVCIYDILSCCTDPGWYSRRGDSTCITIGLPEPAWSEGCKQRVAGVELKALGHHSSRFSFGRGAVFNVSNCSRAACEEPHEVQQV